MFKVSPPPAGGSQKSNHIQCADLLTSTVVQSEAQNGPTVKMDYIRSFIPSCISSLEYKIDPVCVNTPPEYPLWVPIMHGKKINF